MRRAHAVRAMARAGLAEPERVASAMYRGLGRGLGELLCLAMDQQKIEKQGLVALPEGLVSSLSGRGAVLAVAHTGNWDLCACACAERVPLTVVTKHFRVGLLDRWWQGLRRRRGVRLIAEGQVRTEGLAALRRGEWLAMLIDQDPERERGTLRAAFLGAEARVDLAPALVALRARVPLVVALPRRLPGGGHEVLVAATFEPPARPTRAWARAVMGQATAALEAFVQQHPEQWLWMHRRWKGGADA